MELRFRIGPFEWFTVFTGLVLVFYLEYYTFFVEHGWVPDPRRWPRGFTATNVKPLLILLLAVLLGIRLQVARLSRRRIRKFTDLCQQLLWAEWYAELLSLFQRNIREFFRVYRNDYWLPTLRQRLASRVQPRVEDFILEMETPSSRTHVDRIPHSVARALIRCLPTYSSEQRAAAEVVQNVLMNPRFVAALSKARPYLGIEIVRELPGSFEQTSFISGLLTELMANPASVFYWEIEGSLSFRRARKNQNTSQGHRYDIPESNRLIHFLLKDAEVAHRLRVYKPIGDFALRELNQLAADSAGDPYNQAGGDFWAREPGARRSTLQFGSLTLWFRKRSIRASSGTCGFTIFRQW